MTKDQRVKTSQPCFSFRGSAPGSALTMTNANRETVAVQSVQAHVLLLKYNGASEGENLMRFLV